MFNFSTIGNQLISWERKTRDNACISLMLPVPRNKRLKDAKESLLPVNCQNEMPATSLPSLSLEGILISIQFPSAPKTLKENLCKKRKYTLVLY